MNPRLPSHFRGVTPALLTGLLAWAGVAWVGGAGVAAGLTAFGVAASMFALARHAALLRERLKAREDVLCASSRQAERSALESLQTMTARLARERTLLSQVIESIPHMVAWKDRNLRYLGCNSRFARFIGAASPEAVLSRRDGDLAWPEGLADDLDRADRLALDTGAPAPEHEHRIRQQDGGDSTLMLGSAPLRDDDGSIVGVLNILTDTTDRRRLEMQLAQAQRLESIGQLAAGIAHEINTPAQYVGDNIRFLRDEFAHVFALIDAHLALMVEGRPAPDWDERAAAARDLASRVDLPFLRREIPNAIEQSLEGVGRISTIVRAMKDFSHPGSEEKEPADLNAAIRATTTVCRNSWKYVAELELNLDDTLPPVPCLLSEFNQVILNLVVNAADAIAAAIRQYELVTAEKTLLRRTLTGSVRLLTDLLGQFEPALFARAERVRQTARALAHALDLPQSWRFDLAGLLYPLGLLAVPRDVLARHEQGQPLTDDEAAVLDGHPQLTARLLRHIPRLEPVADLIAPPNEPSPSAPGCPIAPPSLEAQVLQLALELDRRILAGQPCPQAIENLRHENRFHPALLDALPRLELPAYAPTERADLLTVEVGKLREGMTLHDDLRTIDGRLLVAAGSQLSPSLVERLTVFRRLGKIEGSVTVSCPHADDTPHTAHRAA
jgi:PAS domain S-box-containing protein